MALRFEVVKPERLTARQLACWTSLQQDEPDLGSPYFHPEFTLDVAAVRDDVEIAVFDRDGESVGFLPFQRARWGIGRPVGWPLSDFQGAIISSRIDWNPADLLPACGLSAWDFDHLLVGQSPFRPYHVAKAASPYMDLTRGFDAYVADRRRAGSEQLAQVLRKARKADRELGVLRFEAHTEDPAVLAALTAWKREQYHRTDARDVLGYRWTRALLERLLARRDEAFRGMISALYIGDRLAAAHVGLRSGRVLHWWFAAYDRGLDTYSPGLLLLVELARTARALGIERIDLGKGLERYKRGFMSGAVTLAEGSVECDVLVKRVRQGWRRCRGWLRSVRQLGQGVLPWATPGAVGR